MRNIIANIERNLSYEDIRYTIKKLRKDYPYDDNIIIKTKDVTLAQLSAKNNNEQILSLLLTK